MTDPKVWSDPSTGERVIAARPPQVVMGETSHLREEIARIGGKLAEAGEKMQAMEAAHAKRVDDLLAANNRYLDRARAAEAAHTLALERAHRGEAALVPFAEVGEFVEREHPGWDHDGFVFMQLQFDVRFPPMKAFRKAHHLLRALCHPPVDETATPDMIAAAWKAWRVRHSDRMSPGPAFKEAIEAALKARVA